MINRPKTSFKRYWWSDQQNQKEKNHEQFLRRSWQALKKLKKIGNDIPFDVAMVEPKKE